MSHVRLRSLVANTLALVLIMLLTGAVNLREPASVMADTLGADSDQYVVLAWNDLGMHCYNRDFQDLAVLPPYNTLWAQVIQVGDPPTIVTSGITVSYAFPDNTYSVDVVFPEGLRTNYNIDLPFTQKMRGKAEIITQDTRLLERIVRPLRSLIQNRSMRSIEDFD